MIEQSITLRVQNSSTFVDGKITGPVYKLFKQALGYKDPNAMWKTGTGNPNWDGYITTVCYSYKYCRCSVKKDGVHFPTGLLSRATDFFKAYGIPVTIIDEREDVPKNKNYSMSPSFELRQYQNDVAVKAVPENTRKGGRGIIKVATGGGKCISEYSLCLTSNGMLTIGEIGNGLLEGKDRPYKATVSSPLSTPQQDMTSRIYRDGVTNSIRIETDFGFHIIGTKKHRIQTVNILNGDFEWKYLPDITSENYVVLTKGQQLFGTKDTILPSDAYWLGLLTGDGSVIEKGRIRLSASDDHIIEFARDYCSKKNLFLSEIPDKRREKLLTLSVSNKEYRKTLLDMGLKHEGALTKTIPIGIRESNKNVVAAYIRGLYETDGWVSFEKCKPTLCISFSSEKLIDQLQSILLNYGIVASKRKKKTSRADHFILTIYRDFIPIFMKEIGLDRRGRKYESITDAMFKSAKCKRNSNADLIPCAPWLIEALVNMLRKWFGPKQYKLLLKDAGLKHKTILSWINGIRLPSRRSLGKLIKLGWEILPECNDLIKSYASDYLMKMQKFVDQQFFFVKVKDIQLIKSDNYDFVVPKSNAFVANGFINHNTAIAAAIIGRANVAPVVFYVTSRDLLKQAKDELEKFLLDDGQPVKVGMVGGGKCEIQDITVMTVQTAVRSLGAKFKKFDDEEEFDAIEEFDSTKLDQIHKLISSAKLIICDEVQHWAAETCQTIADHSDSAKYRFGMSATPWRDAGDDMLIDSCFGKPIADINASFLIKEGILVRPSIYFVPVSYHVSGTYATAYSEGIVKNDERNNLIVNVANQMVKNGRQILILVKLIEHGEILESLIPNSFFIHGSHTGKQRSDWLDKMRRREAPVTIATSIFDEGVDVKPLDGLILAGSGKSQTRALQRIGRVIRSYSDEKTGFVKKDAFIVDFMDDMKYMRNHSKRRKAMYETETEFIIKVYQ